MPSTYTHRTLASLGPKKRDSLFRQLLDAQHDITSLPEARNLSPETLIEWAADPEHLRRLAIMTRLADAQAQWVLARVRLFAITRLTQMVIDDPASESARRACENLLKLNIHDLTPFAPAPETDDNTLTPDNLRALLYDSNASSTTP